MNLGYQFLFYFFGLAAIASALVFVTRKSPVSAALWLVSTMFSLAALYVMMDAHFVGAVQVLVYAGAIMVVFLFVVMLLNLGHAEGAIDIRRGKARLAAGVVGIAVAAQLLTVLRGQTPVIDPDAEGVTNAVSPIAQSLFTNNLLGFEITSLLLLTAIIGAVVLARRSHPGEDEGGALEAEGSETVGRPGGAA